MPELFKLNVKFVGDAVRYAPESRILSVSRLAESTIPAVLRVKAGEKVLLITDVPANVPLSHLQGQVAKAKENRLAMIGRWKKAFETMGIESPEVLVYEETGKHGSPLPQNGFIVGAGTEREVVVAEALASAQILIAMTEFSATGPIKLSLNKERRALSMPGVTDEMEPAMAIDYAGVAATVSRLLSHLEQYNAFILTFKIAHSDISLFVDARGRKFHGDNGVCHEGGTLINFPSGEVYLAPFEGVDGNPSGTNGFLPIFSEDDWYPSVLTVVRNCILPDTAPLSMREALVRMAGNSNIAEFAFGLNPKARATAPVLEAEKAFGIHWAYGISQHLGGAVGSDMADVHQDVVYPVTDSRFRIYVQGVTGYDGVNGGISLIPVMTGSRLFGGPGL
jgi:hypothetical protein